MARNKYDFDWKDIVEWVNNSYYTMTQWKEITKKYDGPGVYVARDRSGFLMWQSKEDGKNLGPNHHKVFNMWCEGDGFGMTYWEFWCKFNKKEDKCDTPKIS